MHVGVRAHVNSNVLVGLRSAVNVQGKVAAPGPFSNRLADLSAVNRQLTGTESGFEDHFDSHCINPFALAESLFHFLQRGNG